MSNFLNELYEKTKTLNSTIPQLKQINDGELVLEVSTDFDKFYIKNFEGNNHYLNLEWSFGTYAITSHSLPDVVKFTEPSSVFDLVKQFYEFLVGLDQFYTCVAVLDSTCCVVEPCKPTKKDCYRVIKFADKVYVLLKFSPFHPYEDLSVTLIGPEKLIIPIRETYEERKKSSAGYENEGFYRYLCNLLDVSFLPEQHEGMPTEKDCAICLDYRNESNQAPFCFCENNNCQGVFHASCLQKYMDDKQHVVIFFNLISGPCPMPYCGSYFKIDKTLFESLKE